MIREKERERKKKSGRGKNKIETSMACGRENVIFIKWLKLSVESSDTEES